MRRAVLRLHGRVGQIRRYVFGLDALCGLGERGVDIAVLAHHRGLRRGEPTAQQFGDIRACDLAVLSFIPGQRHGVYRLLGLPPAVCDDGDRVRQRHDLANALQVADFGLII